MSFEFGMRPQGYITGAAEPEEYDVDEEEADVAVPTPTAPISRRPSPRRTSSRCSISSIAS